MDFSKIVIACALLLAGSALAETKPETTAKKSSFSGPNPSAVVANVDETGAVTAGVDLTSKPSEWATFAKENWGKLLASAAIGTAGYIAYEKNSGGNSGGKSTSIAPARSPKSNNGGGGDQIVIIGNGNTVNNKPSTDSHNNAAAEAPAP